jgi:hypothetical protein
MRDLRRRAEYERRCEHECKFASHSDLPPVRVICRVTMPLLVPVNHQVTKSIKARILQMLPDPGLTRIFALLLASCNTETSFGRLGQSGSS